jgi:hypothetical protein
MPSQAISWQLTLTPTQAQHKQKDRSVVHSIVRPTVHSLFVRSSDRSYDRLWFVRSSDRSSVRPINHCSAVMLPKFRSFVRPIVRPFVHNPYSLSIIRSYELFTIHRIVHSHYSSFIGSFIVNIHRSSDRSFYYSSLLFIVRPIA